MKKIFNIFIFFAIATVFMACSDSKNEIIDNSLKVVSSNVAFDSEGGNGFVEVDQAIVEATTAADWVSTNVEGNKVTFTVSPNYSSRESRNAKLVIKSAQSSVVVAVSQNGFVFNAKSAYDIDTNNSASVQFVPVSYSGTLNIVECPSWIKATVEAKGISLSIDKNETGNLRTGNVVFSAGDFQKSITVTQFDAKDNILGTYIMYYYDGSGEEQEEEVEVKEDAIEIDGLSIPAKFNFETNTLSFTGLTACGAYGPYFLYTMIISGGQLSLSPLPCDFSFVYDAEYGNFVSEGSASFAIGTFAVEEPTAANYKGLLGAYQAPLLLKK